MTESAREQLIYGARRALTEGDKQKACGLLRDALELEFEPVVASAVSRIEAGESVDLDALARDPLAFDEPPESGIDADLFGFDVEVDIEEPVDGVDDVHTVDAADVVDEVGEESPLRTRFEDPSGARAASGRSNVRYRGVAPPPPVHRSQLASTWLEPGNHVETDAGVSSLAASNAADEFEDWDFGGSGHATASSARVERQQVGFDDLSDAMQPSGHLPVMREAIVDAEADDGAALALPAELVDDSIEVVDGPELGFVGDDAIVHVANEVDDSTHWLESGGRARDAGHHLSPEIGTSVSTPDVPRGAFAESTLLSVLDEAEDTYDPAPADEGAAATFDVRSHSRPRHAVVASDTSEELNSNATVLSQEARPTRPAMAPLRWDPDEAVEAESKASAPSEPVNVPASRTGRALHGWRSDESWTVPDDPTPTAESQDVDLAMSATPEPVVDVEPAREAYHADAVSVATSASPPSEPADDPMAVVSGQPLDSSGLQSALTEVSGLMVAGDLDLALHKLNALTAWADHADVVRYRTAIETARERRWLKLVEPITRVPQVSAHSGAIASGALNSRRMFIMSLADGVATLEDVIDMSGMPAHEARQAIGALIDHGVFRFDE